MAIFFNEARIHKKKKSTGQYEYTIDVKYEDAIIYIHKKEIKEKDYAKLITEFEEDFELFKRSFKSEEQKIFEKNYKRAIDRGYIDSNDIKSPEELMHYHKKQGWEIGYECRSWTNKPASWSIFYRNDKQNLPPLTADAEYNKKSCIYEITLSGYTSDDSVDD